MMSEARTKIAILGGGMGAMSAAFALSEVDPHGERYEITVYQQGWRLGGKTASGRNATMGQRIEEHGLHIWAGFYINAFTMMRVVMKRLARPLGTKLATLTDMFVRQNMIHYAQLHEGDWLDWPLWFQPDADPALFPGKDDLWDPDPVMPSLIELLSRLIAFVGATHRIYADYWQGEHQSEATQVVLQLAPDVQAALPQPSPATASCHHALLDLADAFATDCACATGEARSVAERGLTGLLGAYRSLARENYTCQTLPVEIERAFLLGDLAARLVLGIVLENCLSDGLIAIDKFELREFLQYRGALDPEKENPIISAVYDYTFGFKDGSRATPSMSACCATQGLMRLAMTYHGAFFFKATAGFGDTLFTSIYELLKRRGVRFRFFHQVTGLEPTLDGTSVGAVLIDEQAALRTGLDEYQPLVTVGGIGCWPNAPLWDQLAGGPSLQADSVNFESGVVQPVTSAKLRLARGRDFDHVVLGIPIGALGNICAGLLHEPTDAKRAASWSDMVGHLKTVRTQGVQLWLTKEVHTLGGPFVAPDQRQGGSAGPVVINCQPPLDTFADMSQLLPAEAWPADGPKAVAYFCAVMADDAAPDDPRAADAAVRASSQAWITSWLHTLWPAIGKGDDFDWTLLYSPKELTGPARLDEQYWRANITLGERYVLSLPGTLQYRMAPGGSGYTNLFLAGDWTLVPEINAGCVEVAVMSGLLAASALSGVAIPVACSRTLYGPSC